MNKTAYDTLACRSYNVDTIDKKLKLAAIEDDLMSLETHNSRKHISGVVGVAPSNQDVPAFTHPFLFNVNDRYEDSEIFAIDIRPYCKTVPGRGLVFTNPVEYNFNVIRALLNYHWLKEPTDLMNLGALAPIVFCKWLSTAITRRLGLTPADQVKVTTVTLFYWYSLFKEEIELSEKDRMNILMKASDLFSIPSTLTMGFVDEIEHMRGVEDYCKMVVKIVNSPRLDKFSPALLFSMLGGSWFGINVKEVIAVAVEHPPTFIAIVETAIMDRSYRKTTLGTLVLENDKKGRGAEYHKNLSINLLGKYLS